MTRVTASYFLYVLLALNVLDACAQGVKQYVPSTPECSELNQTVMTQFADEHAVAAEAALAPALASGADHAQRSCGALILVNMAAAMAVSGRTAEAERLAERSIKILETIYLQDDPVLLTPLQILAVTRFEQGKTARAREAFKRMQVIRIQRPEDSALVHGIAGSVFEMEGRRADAEAEYLAAFRAWVEAGFGETAEAGTILNNLALLYLREQRLDEARQALDRALAVFSRAKDAVPLDRIKLLTIRGVLNAWQGDWLQAEQDLRDALAMTDREPWVNPVALRSLLTNYAVALRKNHHRREARSIEARAAAMPADRRTAAIVDFTDLLPKRKPSKK